MVITRTTPLRERMRQDLQLAGAAHHSPDPLRRSITLNSLEPAAQANSGLLEHGIADSASLAAILNQLGTAARTRAGEDRR
jgi:hypothetical protein